MVEVTAQVRAWGRSVGVVIPKQTVMKTHLKPGDEVKLLILKKKNPLVETFGMGSFSKPTERILKEIDKEAWNE